MGVSCKKDCRHYNEAKENIDQLERGWELAFKEHDFTVPRAEIRLYKCPGEECEGNRPRKWRRLNPEIVQEYLTCEYCNRTLTQAKKEKEEEVLDQIPQENKGHDPCRECGSDDFDYSDIFEVCCKICGVVDKERAYESNDNQPINLGSGSYLGEKGDNYWKMERLLGKKINKSDAEKKTVNERRAEYDRLDVERIVSGADTHRLTKIQELCGATTENWPEMAKVALGRGVSNLPPRYCQCRKSIQSQGRSRMILHLHQILQERGNFNSISEMLSVAGVHPRYFSRFINSGLVGNHLPSLNLSHGRNLLRQAVPLLIDSEDSPEIDNLLLDRIQKQFDALVNSEQFFIFSNLENGLWSFKNNMQPYARENGYIIMMIPYAIAITRGIRDVYGQSMFRQLTRRLGKIAMSDARFTGGELHPEPEWID